MFNVSFSPNVKSFYKLNNNLNKINQAFKGSVSDTFEKSNDKIYGEEKLVELLNTPSFNISKKFMESLSPEEYQFCLNYAKGTEKCFEKLLPENRVSVLPEDVRDVAKYSDGIYKGIQKIAERNNMNPQDILLVAIGQSPDSIVKAMEFKGMRTAYCPLSNLRLFNNHQNYVNEETIENGFSYWKNYGFDLDSIFKEKMIIFLDHKETGTTLDGFKQIIYKIRDILDKDKNKPTAKMHFIPLKDLHRKTKQSVFDSILARETEDSLFHTSYFKTLYSPLFKLPLDKISSIKELSLLNSSANVRFNKFSVLLYDELLNPSKSSGFKSHGRLEAQREIRLSAVVSELFK